MLRFRSMVMTVVHSVQSEKVLYFIQLTQHLQLGVFIENVRHFFGGHFLHKHNR